MTFVQKATLVKNKEEGKKGKEEEGKKKRVDVKETRNLAKNKGREKKDGRKNAHSYNSLTAAHACRKGSATGWELIKTSEVSVRTVL